MKTRKLAFVGILLAGIFGAKAQNSIILKSATPQVSTTIAGGNSVMIGDGAGNAIQPTAGANVFVGFISGMNNSTATDNTFIGWGTGSNNTTGKYNTFIGRSAGGSNITGENNTYLGYLTGLNATGHGNVFLGRAAGYNETGSNKLMIDNDATASPLIWGDFATDQVKLNGKVGIGGNSTTGFGAFPTTVSGVNISAYNLFVKGGILTDEVRVSLNSTWADYVFTKDYNLKPLSEVESYIAKNGHLPNVPSAAQVKEEGINVADMARIQQEKIEELTLYIIQLNKEIEKLKTKIK